MTPAGKTRLVVSRFVTCRKVVGALVILTVVLSGCATTGHLPELIGKAPEHPIDVSEVQQDPQRFLGNPVRWGGTIIGVENLKNATRIEILSRPLSKSGKPDLEQPGQGRFLAELKGFVDPANYPEGRLLTVAGKIAGVVKRPIGNYPYTYPVVTAEAQYLWPKPVTKVYPAYPYPYYDPFYDPFFDPWYPWGYRPYYW